MTSSNGHPDEQPMHIGPFADRDAAVGHLARWTFGADIVDHDGEPPGCISADEHLLRELSRM